MCVELGVINCYKCVEFGVNICVQCVNNCNLGFNLLQYYACDSDSTYIILFWFEHKYNIMLVILI